MNRLKPTLLLISLLTTCLFFTAQATAQRDGQVRPHVAVPDPCSFPNPPSTCMPPPTTPPVPRDTRKGIVLGPASVVSQDAINGDQDLRGPMFGTGLPSNISILNDSATGYVRLWVDWSVLMPRPTFGNFIRVDSDTKPLIESLDAQIVEARRNGLKVILTVNHRYPTWVVWYKGNKAPSGSCGNREICKRVPSSLDEDSPWGGFISFLVSEYGFTTDKTKPDDPAYNRYVDFLEVVNEPNLTHRTPEKRTKGGRLVIALDVADMFVTSQKIVRDQNAALRAAGKLAEGETTLKLAGPATADTLKNDRKLTDYQEFTEELLRALDRRGFVAGSGFVWTHHNHLDSEEQRYCLGSVGGGACAPVEHCPGYGTGRTISPVNSAAWVQKRLDNGVGGYRWRGMRDGAGNPAIFLTEGGVRLSQVMAIYYCQLGIPKPVKRDARKPDDPAYVAFEQAVAEKIGDIKRKQAELVGNSFDRMSRGPLSKGILLFTNYLTYTDPIYDSGMFDYAGRCGPIESEDDWYDRSRGNICTGEGGIERPLFATWKALRTPSP